LSNFRFNLKTSRVYRAFFILAKTDRSKILAITIVQTLLGFLDLIGVILIGMLGAVSIQGIQTGQSGSEASKFLRLIGAEGFSFQQEVAFLGFSACFVFLLKTALSIFFTRKVFFFLSHKNALLSNKLIEKVLSQNLVDLQKKSKQEIQYILSDGVRNLLLGVIGTAVAIVSDVAMLIIVGIGLYFVDPIVALSSICLFLFIGFFLHRQLQVRANAIGVECTKLTIQSYEKTFEVLNSYRESVVRHRRKFYSQQIGKIRFQLADTVAEQNFLPYISKYVIESTTILSSLLLAGYAFGRYTAVEAVATLTVFLAASSRIAPAALRIQQGLLTIKTSSGSAENTLELIDSLRSIPLLENLPTSNDFVYVNFVPEVRASNIEFTYPGNDRFSIGDISFYIEPGSVTAIAGPSGAGKTTLIDVLLGILIPDTGSITISGVNPDVASRRWSGAISYVPQSVSIISGTVRENVAMGYDLSTASDEAVWKALDFAQLGDTFRKLPQGLETQVGETGDQISGGERQRLGLARALFTSPKLLILDEATSSLDGITEAEITKSLQMLTGEVTVIIVAHRLSTIRNAQQVLYIKAGKLIAQGNFEEVRKQVPEFNLQAKLMGL
jgi:ATP-binding cassette, subfamily B, bacterial PglK